jgi:hypothetical protein
MSIAIKSGAPLLEGNLLKKNKWYMKQERRFKLYANGKIIYFKGQEEKGIMELSRVSKARKVSRSEVELTLKDDHKIYILM